VNATGNQTRPVVRIGVHHSPLGSIHPSLQFNLLSLLVRLFACNQGLLAFTSFMNNVSEFRKKPLACVRMQKLADIFNQVLYYYCF